jgi:hypothetical protein
MVRDAVQCQADRQFALITLPGYASPEFLIAFGCTHFDCLERADNPRRLPSRHVDACACGILQKLPVDYFRHLRQVGGAELHALGAGHLL